ncbi:MAG: hypothetical protein ACXWM6_07450 [Thermodesulfobacteriota bacterium]
MKKAGTGTARGIKEDTLIVTIDIGLEMNRGYCTTTDERDIKPFRFDNTRAVGGGQEEPKMALVASLALERGHSYPLPPFILMGGFIPSC